MRARSTAEADRFLELLPKDNDQMPLAVRERLARIRQQVEDRAAKAATAATTITLSAKDMPLTEVFAAIEKQTGNKFIDNREQQGDDADAKDARITIELKDEPFWPAIDQILDQAKLGIYSYGGEDALSIVSRDAATTARATASRTTAGRSAWKSLEVQAQRNLRQPQADSRSSSNWKSPGNRGCGRSRSRSRRPICRPRPMAAAS